MYRIYIYLHRYLFMFLHNSDYYKPLCLFNLFLFAGKYSIIICNPIVTGNISNVYKLNVIIF